MNINEYDEKTRKNFINNLKKIGEKVGFDGIKNTVRKNDLHQKIIISSVLNDDITMFEAKELGLTQNIFDNYNINLNGDTRPKNKIECIICKCIIFSTISWKIESMPKRLLYLPLMKVIEVKDLCYNCYDGASEFTIISHVWGETNLYSAEELNVSGINWNVPLSKKDKINKIKNIKYDENIKYVWFDVLCMKQDDKNDINRHIPFMSNYYTKSDKCIALMATNFQPETNLVEWLTNDEWTKRVWTLPEMILPLKVILISDKYEIELDDIINDIRKRKYVINNKFSSPGLRAINHLLENGKDVDISSCHKLMYGRQCMYEEDKIHAMMSMLNSKLDTMYGIDIDEAFASLISEQIKNQDYSFIGWKDGKGNNTINKSLFPKMNKFYDWYKIIEFDYSNSLSINHLNQLSLFCIDESIVYDIKTINTTDNDELILQNLCNCCYLINLSTKVEQLDIAIDLLRRCNDDPINGDFYIQYVPNGVYKNGNFKSGEDIDLRLEEIKEKIYYIKKYSKANKLYLITGKKERGWCMYLSEYKPQLNLHIIQTNFKIGIETYLWFFARKRGQYLYRESAFLHKESINIQNDSWKMIA